MSATGATPVSRESSGYDRPSTNGRDTDHNSHNTGRRLSTETKAAYKTTEFVAYLAVVAGILIAAASITGGGAHIDKFGAGGAWLMVTIVTSAYLISRGIAKSGSKQPYDER